MGTAVIERERTGNPARIVQAFRLILVKGILEEAKRGAGNCISPARQIELNDRLWLAFLNNDRGQMCRLVNSGADPVSVERRFDSEVLGHGR